MVFREFFFYFQKDFWKKSLVKGSYSHATLDYWPCYCLINILCNVNWLITKPLWLSHSLTITLGPIGIDSDCLTIYCHTFALCKIKFIIHSGCLTITIIPPLWLSHYYPQAIEDASVAWKWTKRTRTRRTMDTERPRHRPPRHQICHRKPSEALYPFWRCAGLADISLFLE